MKKIHWFTDTTIQEELGVGEMFDITEKENVKQIFKILKLQKNECIVIKTNNFVYECKITEVTRDKVTVSILNKKQVVTQQKISLVFCIPKKITLN